MATRSRIGYVNENDEVVSSYCHWDGYPSNNGKILLENYNSLEAIKELVSFGNISSLNVRIYPLTENHSFEKPEEDCTVFYGRDREEEDQEPKVSTLKKFHSELNEEYNYLFKDGKWYCNKRVLTLKMCGIK